MTLADDQETVLVTEYVYITIDPGGPNGPCLRIVERAPLGENRIVRLYTEEATDLLESDVAREAFGIDQ